jgi:putative phosphoribosyl transferase
MYFKSRVDAGKTLAAQLAPKYRYENCAIVALSDGGVIVGAQIAMELHCVLTMLLTETIDLPREEVSVAGISSDGAFSYNNYYSPGEIEEFVSEYYHLIEQEKMSKMQDMHRLLGQNGLIRRDLLKGHTVILVSDGLSNGFSLDLAAAFLKPINIEKLVVATPLASVQAVDRMHILGDEIYCLSVVQDYINTDHYYDKRDIPPHEKILKTIEQIVLHWK